MSSFEIDSKKLRAARRAYHSSTERPFRVTNNGHNYVLLSEGLDVIWNNMGSNLENLINCRQYREAQPFTRANLSGIKITIELYTPRQLVKDLIAAGAQVEFNRVVSYRVADTMDNAITVVTNCTISNTRPMLDGSFDLSVDYLNLVGIEYDLREYERRYSTFHELIDHFYRVSEEVRTDMFNYYAGQGMNGYLEIILRSGYIPVNIQYQRFRSRVKLNILRDIKLDDNDKYQLFKQMLIKVSDDYLLYNHPSVSDYWNRLFTEFQNNQLDGKLDSRVMQYLKTNQLPEIEYDCQYANPGCHCVEPINKYDLNKINQLKESGIEIGCIHDVCPISALELFPEHENTKYFQKLIKNACSRRLIESTHPIFEKYRSVIPNNRNEFLQYMDYMGLELPPSNGMEYVSPGIIRSMQDIISKKYTPNQIIEANLDEFNRCKLSVLINLARMGLIDLRPYGSDGGFKHDDYVEIIDEIIKYQKVNNLTKNARSKYY